MQPGESDLERVLLIGGGGFIGSYIARALIARNIPLRVFDRDDARVHENLAGLDEVDFVVGDTGNHGEVDAALAGVTDVVYLAHSTVPASSMMDLAFDLESNVPPVIYLLSRVRESKTLQRLVYFSSGGTVYAEKAEPAPFTERDLTMPISAYGITKLIGEHYM
jgi:UDP-glucose 4-epimerase